MRKLMLLAVAILLGAGLAVFGVAPAEADVVLTGDTAEEAPVTAPGSPIPLNPRATYLRTNADSGALNAAPTDLFSPPVNASHT